MKMKHPKQDVGLVDGEGYCAEEVAYREHLAVAIEHFQVWFQWCPPWFADEAYVL